MMKLKRRHADLPEPDFQEKPNTLPERVYRAFETIDEMPEPLRRVVHEIGWEPVQIMINHRLPPNVMLAIAHACWTAPRSPHQIQGKSAPKELRSSPVLQHLDTLLNRAGAQISAMMLLRMLRQFGMVIVPLVPSTSMIAASMETVSRSGVPITKEQKHRLRLEAALLAGAKRLWPHLFEKECHSLEKLEVARAGVIDG